MYRLQDRQISTMALELSPHKRGQIWGMKRMGATHALIAEEFGICTKTVSNTLKREALYPHGSALPRSGRPRAMTKGDCRRLISWITENPFASWKEIAAEAGQSEGVVWRETEKVGLTKRKPVEKPVLGKGHRALRREWAEANTEQDWRRIVFADESAFRVGEIFHDTWGLRPDGEAMVPKYLQETFRSGRQTMMIWGAIAYGKKFDLVRLPVLALADQSDGLNPHTGLNAKRYIQYVLKGPMKKALKVLHTRTWGDVFAVEDNAPCHTAAAAQAARVELGIPTISHPPNSPDLNPIENLWAILKQIVGRMVSRATNLDMLWEQIQQAYAEIPQRTINRIVMSMYERVVAVDEADGGHTR